MEFESIKRLGLDHIGIDTQKSFETYDQDTNNHIIIIHLLKSKNVVCPLCGSDTLELKGSKSQFLKYSSVGENNITLKLYRRIYRCKDCGHYSKETNPFGSNQRKTTIQTDYKILGELKSFETTYTKVANKFNVSTTYVINLFDKKVDMKRLPLPEVMCVDEVYSKKISYHKYCFIIYSPFDRKIIDVLDSRRYESLDEYFSHISITERDKVKYFSIDLYDTYRLIAKKYFPKAKLCADSFHVIKNLSNFFHQIRIRVMKKYAYLKLENDNYYWLFKRYWKLLTKDRTKMSHERFKVNQAGQYMSQFEIIDYMLSISKELKLAYELLHEYRNFNETANVENAEEWLNELILKFQNCLIEEYIPAWKLLSNWRLEIINSFNKINGRRISNGPMERVNRDIKTIFRMAFGSTNFFRMRNRIMYCLNDNAPILYTRKKYTNKRTFKKRGNYRK